MKRSRESSPEPQDEKPHKYRIRKSSEKVVNEGIISKLHTREVEIVGLARIVGMGRKYRESISGNLYINEFNPNNLLISSYNNDLNLDPLGSNSIQLNYSKESYKEDDVETNYRLSIGTFTESNILKYLSDKERENIGNKKEFFSIYLLGKDGKAAKRIAVNYKNRMLINILKNYSYEQIKDTTDYLIFESDMNIVDNEVIGKCLDVLENKILKYR